MRENDAEEEKQKDLVEGLKILDIFTSYVRTSAESNFSQEQDPVKRDANRVTVEGLLLKLKKSGVNSVDLLNEMGRSALVREEKISEVSEVDKLGDYMYSLKEKEVCGLPLSCCMVVLMGVHAYAYIPTYIDIHI